MQDLPPYNSSSEGHVIPRVVAESGKRYRNDEPASFEKTKCFATDERERQSRAYYEGREVAPLTVEKRNGTCGGRPKEEYSASTNDRKKNRDNDRRGSYSTGGGSSKISKASCVPEFLELFLKSKFKLWGDINRAVEGMPRNRVDISSQKQIDEILQYISNRPEERELYLNFREFQDNKKNIPELPPPSVSGGSGRGSKLGSTGVSSNMGVGSSVNPLSTASVVPIIAPTSVAIPAADDEASRLRAEIERLQATNLELVNAVNTSTSSVPSIAQTNVAEPVADDEAPRLRAEIERLQAANLELVNAVNK
jgi:hypothetical protein